MAPTLAVLAGDRYRHARIPGQATKALLTFGGRTSLERVLRAAERSRTFGGVIVVGPPDLDQAIVAAGVWQDGLGAGLHRREQRRTKEQQKECWLDGIHGNHFIR